MAGKDRIDQFKSLARGALRDLFDQEKPFGRLALVQVLMLSGGTLVTISLAGSLFFSISPKEAESKVLLYLLFTLAPFAVISPLLGPMIDRSRSARKAIVIISALASAGICPVMAGNIHNFWLFPLALMILIFSNLYLVTCCTLVPEFIPTQALGPQLEDPKSPSPKVFDFASLNARLTLLGTLAGFVASIPGVILLKTAKAPAVLIFAALVFIAAGAAGFRLPLKRLKAKGQQNSSPLSQRTDQWKTHDELHGLQPIAHPEVLFGLTTISLIKGLSGFLIFLLAFGLRREHASLWWYGLALGASGAGSLVGLMLVSRIRRFIREPQILLFSIWAIGAGALGAFFLKGIMAQVGLAFVVGLTSSVALPSFNAISQRFVPKAVQGRAFARFATRQQLIWVVGAILPVLIDLGFGQGDLIMAAVAGIGGLFYVTSRKAARTKAFPRGQAQTKDP